MRRVIFYADCPHELADTLCQDTDWVLMSRQASSGPSAESMAQLFGDPVSHQRLQAAETSVRGVFPKSTLEKLC